MNDWNSSPSKARWYAEVIFGTDDDAATDYNYGYSAAEFPPDPMELLPEGTKLISVHITPLTLHMFDAC